MEDAPHPPKQQRVSLIMVRTLSTRAALHQDTPKKEKIPEKPVDEDDKREKKSTDPATLGPEGALHYYAKMGDVEGMRKCYKEGAKVDVPELPQTPSIEEGEDEPNNPITGDYPLHMAAGGGHEAALNEILTWEADTEAKNRIGSTALHRAVSHDQREIVKKLLSEGASIDAVNKIGNTPLHCACYLGSMELAKLLIEAQASAQINQPNKFGATPIMFAAQSSSTLCKFLLKTRQMGGLMRISHETKEKDKSPEKENKYPTSSLHTPEETTMTKESSLTLDQSISLEKKEKDLLGGSNRSFQPSSTSSTSATSSTISSSTVSSRTSIGTQASTFQDSTHTNNGGVELAVLGNETAET